MEVIVEQNLEYLARNTVNFEMILNLLAQEGVLNFEEWDALLNLERSYYDKVSILYLDYITNKCPFQTLFKCLKESSNKDIADKLSTHGFLGETPCSRSATGSVRNFTDFVVEVKHVKFISKILNEEIDEKTWEEIKILWLNQKMRNDVGKKSSMKLDILGCLNAWITGTVKEERLYSKIVECFEDYPAVKDKLMQDFWMGTSHIMKNNEER